MDRINEMTLGEKLVCGGAILMLIASFLAWYKVDFGIEGIAVSSVSRNGWQSPGAIWSILAVIISLALAGSILGARFGNMRLPELGQFTWGQAYLAGGALVAICLVIKLVNESSYLSIGFFLGIVAAALVAAGGYLIYSEEKGGAGVTGYRR